MSILRKAGVANVLSDRQTIEYILERLSKGFTNIVPGQTNGSFTFSQDSSCIFYAPEMSIFTKASTSTFEILNDLWEYRAPDDPFLYATRHKGDYKIKSPCQSLLAGTAPAYLLKTIPDDAVGGGFTSRVNFVLERDPIRQMPVGMLDMQMEVTLIDELKRIAQLHGEYKMCPSLEPIFKKYYESQISNEFDDEALANYTARKGAHVVKLAMILSASRGDDLLITDKDLYTAMAEIDHVAEDVSMVFRAIGESDFTATCDRVLRYLELKGNATFQELLKANWKYADYNSLTIILTTLTQAGLIADTTVGGKVSYKAVKQFKTKGVGQP
jgi:hypothetical protein